jgi:tetratricopeptide (TPR) repeat protein
MELTTFIQQHQLMCRKERYKVNSFLTDVIAQADGANKSMLGAVARMELALSLIDTRQNNSLNKAEELLQQAEFLLKKGRATTSQEGYLSYCRGMLKFESSDMANALLHLQNAYIEYTDDLLYQAIVDDGMGKYYAEIGDFQKALFHFERALINRTDSHDEHNSGNSYKNLGRLQLRFNNLEIAEEYFQQSLQIALIYEDELLRLQSLIGLEEVALATGRYQDSKTLIGDALQIVHSPIDDYRIAFLYRDLAEALLGNGEVEESYKCLESEVMPRFQALKSSRGIAIAKRVKGRIKLYRLIHTIDEVSENAVENTQDILLDAAMVFEQQGMTQEYARTLYDLAGLYNLCTNHSTLFFQYQGKMVRSLELALSVLEQFEVGNDHLISEIENALNQAMSGVS